MLFFLVLNSGQITSHQGKGGGNKKGLRGKPAIKEWPSLNNDTTRTKAPEGLESLRNQDGCKYGKVFLKCQEHAQCTWLSHQEHLCGRLTSIYCLLMGSEHPVKGGVRSKTLCASLNPLLKMTMVHSKCWRMTTLQHFCELLTSFLIKITYPFVLLKIAHFYFSKSQINYSLKHVEQKRWREHSLTLHFRGLLILYPVW